MSVTADKNQRYMMLALPFVFVLFVRTFPAGLLVYWITTNLWTVGQQYVVRRTVGHMGPTAGHRRKARRRQRPKPSRRRRWLATEAAARPACARRGGGEQRRWSDPPPRPPRKKKKRSGRRR